MDEEYDWIEEMTRYDQVPKWLRTSTREVNTVIASLSKRPSKNTLLGGNIGVESSEVGSETERKRGRPKGKKHLSYKEVDDENGEYSEASSDERNGYPMHEEEGEVGELEDDEYSGAVEATPVEDKEQVEEDGPDCDGGYDYPPASERVGNDLIVEEAGSSGSSSDSRRLMQPLSPVSSQKFGSLSALDGRSGSISKRLPDEVEEGEIVVSGDSHIDHQQSGSWIHDRDEGEDEQVLQPKIKRKRSLRVRPRHAVERPEEKSGSETQSVQRGDSSLLPFQVDHKSQAPIRVDRSLPARSSSESTVPPVLSSSSF